MQKQKSKKGIFRWFIHYGGALFFLAMGLFFFLGNENSENFKAAVLPGSSSVAYDGTALPIQKVPQWTNVPEAQWGGDYDSFSPDQLMPLPHYDPALLKVPLKQLVGQSSSDLTIRNLKTTYPAVFMGNYKLDGIEYVGSHLAIDIRALKNTPVFAIGNGVVVTLGNQTDGFGQHIVLKHENFPSFNDPSKRVTYYSSYSHLAKTLVSEGQVVRKGDLIGKSGQTGLASVPHLHFQIDSHLAPWHPYWPFTYQEARSANVDFIGAINIGLGKEKALQVTVNPMLYVQKYLGDNLHGSPNTASKKDIPVSTFPFNPIKRVPKRVVVPSKKLYGIDIRNVLSLQNSIDSSTLLLKKENLNMMNNVFFFLDGYSFSSVK